MSILLKNNKRDTILVYFSELFKIITFNCDFFNENLMNIPKR